MGAPGASPGGGEEVRLLVAALGGVTYRRRADSAWTLEHAGPGTLELLGFPPEAIAGRSLAERLPEADRIRAEDEIRQDLAAGRPFRVAYLLRDARGQERMVQDVGRAIPGADGRPEAIEGILFDISRHHRLEERESQFQRLESVGRLAAGVAHEFNNMLVAITGFAEMALSMHDPEDPVCVYLKEISGAAGRSAKLAGQLLAFSRKQVLRPKVLDLGKVLSGMEGLLQELLGADVEVGLEVVPGQTSVRVDPAQLEQVILNLALNARDAMPQGGRLTIRTGLARFQDPAEAAAVWLQPGEYVYLSLEDTGLGMDEATLSHLFEPFFTTKSRGRGAGLGLATTYGVVKQSNGSIIARSRPGAGSTFTVYLPRASGTHSTTTSSARVDPKLLKGTETILIVEDESMVRALVLQVLRSCGYTVIEAASAEEAVERSRSFPGTIHLVLTDVVMPGESGPQLARRLASERPQARVLFMSGYAHGELGQRGLLEEGTPFLEKPFTPYLLMLRVREVLGGVPVA